MTIDTPVSLICLARTNTSSCSTGDRPAEGSSSSSTDGSIISARPIATIWRSPPDSEPGPLVEPLAEAREQLDDVLDAVGDALGLLR